MEDVDDQIAETVPFVPAIPQHLTDDDMLAALRGTAEVSVTVAEMGMTKADGVAGPDSMAKPEAMATDPMAKPGAMAAPAAVMSVSRLRMIAATCGM